MTTAQSTARKARVNPALATPTDLAASGVAAVSSELRQLLADVFALYVKTKNFHWHMSGRHFRDYHLLLDEQSDQIFAMTDDLAERARKIGGTSLHSIGDITRHQRLKDNDEDFVAPGDMLAETHRRQPAAHAFPPRSAQGVRRGQRRGHGQPDRKLDRRDRAPHLVLVRGEWLARMTARLG